MSSGGGSNTSTQSSTSNVELPAWLDTAAQKNVARAQQVADIGYTPYYGLDVAGFSPMQTSAMQNTANAASAFGLGAPTDVMAGMPKTTTNNLGFTGYSSGDMFDTALAQLAANRPAQYLGIQQQFTDPVTGVASVPTAMDILTNPDSTDAQIQSLYGSYGGSNSSSNSDIEGGSSDERSPLEVYQDSLKWLAGEGGWIQDNIGKTGLIGTGLSKLADWGSKNAVESYLGNYTPFMNEGEYGLMTDANGNYKTSNKTLADRMGWEYYQPAIVSPISPSGDFSWTGGGGGGNYTWGSASDASRQSSALDSGTGSGIGSGGGNASRGFSTGGW